MEFLINDPFYSGAFVMVGMAFLLLEVFIPSGGILGVLSVAFSAFGIYGFFHQGSPVIAVMALGFNIVLVGIGLRFGLRRIRHEGILTAAETSADEKIEALLGKEGVTVSQLRPAGIALIDGRRRDVVSAGSFVAAGVPVRVVDNSGNRIVVRAIDARNAADQSGDDTATEPETMPAES